METKLYFRQKILNYQNRIRQAERTQYPGWKAAVSELNEKLEKAETELQELVDEVSVVATATTSLKGPLGYQILQPQQQQGVLLSRGGAAQRQDE